MLVVGGVMRHQLVGIRNGNSAQKEGNVNDGLPHQNFFGVVGGIDEGFEQMDGADANDGGAQLDLQYRSIHVIKPFGLVRVAF